MSGEISKQSSFKRLSLRNSQTLLRVATFLHYLLDELNSGNAVGVSWLRRPSRLIFSTIITYFLKDTKKPTLTISLLCIKTV